MAKGLAKQYVNSLNKTGGKSSGPEDRFDFNLLIIATTLSSSKLTVSRMLFNSITEQHGMLPLSTTPTVTYCCIVDG